MTGRNIELHIEELVLHGFEKRDRYRIAEAMQTELARLGAQKSLTPKLQIAPNVEKVDAGSFSLHANAKPEMIGRQIARNVYQGLGKWI